MNKFTAIAAASMTVLFSLHTVPAQAALQPFGAIYFCKQNAQECAGGGANSVKATNDLMALLQKVNSHVNRSITYRAEALDEWTLNPRFGDCEDYALSKRSALIKSGVAPNSLRIGMTKTRRGEPHAVLIVRTSVGNLILDNRTAAIRHIKDTEYRIEAMSAGSLHKWTRG